MRNIRRRFVAVVSPVVAIVAVVTALVAAQSAPPPPPTQPPAPPPPQDPAQPPPRFRVDASFVRVDAYPTKDGKAVLDLTAADFEVLEDNVPQAIETFEHIVVRPAGPQEERVDPGSQRAVQQALSNPRNRVFVIFLDTPHVTVPSAHAINEPLIRLIDRILGPDDLVGVMTPAMSASQIAFGRKTQVIESSLRANWAWGTRFTNAYDEREQAYIACYPPLSGERSDVSGLAKEMIQRKRERATLDAFEDLVRYLRTLREERKAILTVTEGWMLYGENRAITKLREDAATGYKEPVPGVDPVGVGPNGTLTNRDPRRLSSGALNKSECDSDRLMLAMLDNKRAMIDLMDEANFGNASFYPIDPRGLAVFDNPIGPEPPPPVSVDIRMLESRIEVMRTLAENTDGIAVVNSNDLDRGLRRISDDLSSYYLLGYNSTNSKLDGRFRSLKVRVKRPGVDVRARRGYRAALATDVDKARTAASAVPETTRAATAALDRLSRVRPDAQLKIHAIASTPTTVWVAGELRAAVAGRPDEFAQGASGTIDVTGGAQTKLALKPGERTFLISIPLTSAPAGEIDVRTRITPAGGALPVTDNLRLNPKASGEPMLFRRGPSTGNRLVPAPTFAVSRTERLRIEVPIDASVKPGSGRLLDRAGQPLQVPVTVGERADADTNQRWLTADVSLAPLAPSDYLVELVLQGASEQRTLVPVRVTR